MGPHFGYRKHPPASIYINYLSITTILGWAATNEVIYTGYVKKEIVEIHSLGYAYEVNLISILFSDDWDK